MQAELKADFVLRAAYIGFMAETPPCENCYCQSYCEQTGFTCKAFRHFVKSGKWQSKHMKVSLR